MIFKPGDGEPCLLCDGSGFMAGKCGHYYNWELQVSSDENWHDGLDTRIIDNDTGEEINYVCWCNSSTGDLCRLAEDEECRLATSNGELVEIREKRNFRVEYTKERIK